MEKNFTYRQTSPLCSWSNDGTYGAVFRNGVCKGPAGPSVDPGRSTDFIQEEQSFLLADVKEHQLSAISPAPS